MATSLLFYMFICSLAEVSARASADHSCDGAATWSQAEHCCRLNGGKLGSFGNESEMNQVLKYMSLYNMTSSWVNLRRRDMHEWRWIDGESGGFLDDIHNNKSCVWFNQKARRLEPGWCSDTTAGSMCQNEDPGCQNSVPSGIGREHDGICYLHYCERLTWHEARAYCHTWGYTMALVKRRNTSEELARYHWNCDRFWVGLRKEEWLDDTDAQVGRIYRNWDPHQIKDTGRCGRVKIQHSSLIFEPRSCHSDVTFVCIALQTGSDIKTPRKTTHRTTLIVSCSVGAAVFSVGVLVGVLIYRRKREDRRRRTAVPGQTTEEENVPLQQTDVGEMQQPQRNNLRRLLADTLLKLYNKIDLWSWHDKHVTVPMDEIYVDLVWVRIKQGLSGQRHHRLASYTEMLPEVKINARRHTAPDT